MTAIKVAVNAIENYASCDMPAKKNCKNSAKQISKYQSSVQEIPF